jgi:hypothetical protein
LLRSNANFRASVQVASKVEYRAKPAAIIRLRGPARDRIAQS